MTEARIKIAQLLSVEQVANALGVSAKTVRRRIAEGSLKAYQIGRQLRISIDDYHGYVAQRRTSL